MKTTKLYQSDVYTKEWSTHITSASECEIPGREKGIIGYLLTLKETAFFPEGGGQSCDTGFIDNLRVIDVQERDGEIYHTVTADSTSAAFPAEGTEVRCRLDWERRFDNMQRHCGEHILSGVFYSLYGGVNRGFHMGEDYMTIDIRLEENPRFSRLTHEMALKAELEANKVIWSDAPVTVLRFDNRKEAEKMPLRKALAFDEDISIVSVGSVENAADCVACCGTHPSSAGQVGIIKVYKTEKYKDMYRIYFDAGRFALADYDFKHDILSGMSAKYSSSIEDFPDKLNSREEKYASLKDELFHLKKAFINEECHKLDELLKESSQRVITYPLSQLSLDDAFSMGKRYMEKNQEKLIMLYSEKDTSYVLVSGGNIHCGNLVREYASLYGGKGGGGNTSARAIFSTQRDAKLFSELLTKHLNSES